MLFFQSTEGRLTGMDEIRDSSAAVSDSFVRIDRNQRGILYYPMDTSERKTISLVFIHSDDDYSTRPLGKEMALRGYTVFCGQVEKPAATLDAKMLNVGKVVSFLRTLPWVKEVVLIGHSGGATLMTAYQAVAENGPGIFQGKEMIIPCSIEEVLPPADGIALLDSNWGNGAMTLFSVDPAVVEEGNGLLLNPEFDLFAPENGYIPEGAHYSEEFKKNYFSAQRERNNRLIRLALDRWTLIRQGKGEYREDEPFIIAGGAQFAPCNRLFPQDLHLLAHTRDAFDLLHADGMITHQMIPSVRKAKGKRNPTSDFGMGTLVTTVQSFLRERAVWAGEEYQIGEDRVTGVLWDQSYDCPPANVKHIHVPLLCMGMTGSYEYLAAEEIYRNAGSADKSIAFVEGAGHNFETNKESKTLPGQFGDTSKTLYDYLDGWLNRKG